MEDTLVAVTQPVGSSNSKEFFVIGKSYTYLLSGEIDQIDNMIKNLDPAFLTLEDRIEVFDPQRSGAKISFSASLNFIYERTDNGYSEKERNLLGKQCGEPVMGAHSEHSKYRCNTKVKVKLFQGLTISGIENHKLSQGRKIQLVLHYPAGGGVDPDQIVNKTSLLPIAIVADVVTSPFQALLLYEKVTGK